MLLHLQLARSSLFCKGQSFTRLFRASPLQRGLEEFYDTKSHLRVNENPVAGRAWEASELRRKSFTDLHKLWYVLLKERNALLTESTRARRFNMRIKYPQRKTAVRKSMGRIKQVGLECCRRICPGQKSLAGTRRKARSISRGSCWSSRCRVDAIP